jgi:hypothetical protein
MKVYLSNKPSPDSSFKHHSNLASLDRTFSDSEITSLTIDCFLSSFSFVELEQAIKEVLKKCRIGCEVTIIEIDCNLLFRLYTREEVEIHELNNLFFDSSKKSILNTETIEKSIPNNFEVEEKSISNLSFLTMKLRRVR